MRQEGAVSSPQEPPRQEVAVREAKKIISTPRDTALRGIVARAKKLLGSAPRPPRHSDPDETVRILKPRHPRREPPRPVFSDLDDE